MSTSITMIDRIRSQPERRSAASASGERWPVNEVVLQSLIYGGQDTAQIADRYGVAPHRVLNLRRTFGL